MLYERSVRVLCSQLQESDNKDKGTSGTNCHTSLKRFMELFNKIYESLNAVWIFQSVRV